MNKLTKLLIGKIPPIELARSIVQAERERNMTLSDQEIILLVPIDFHWLSSYGTVEGSDNVGFSTKQVIKYVHDWRLALSK